TEPLPEVTRWRPLSVDDAAAVFRPLGVSWWIAGGWAIDLFAGRQTRDHGDIDIAMLRDDARALGALAAEFDIVIAYDGALTPWDGGALVEPYHQFWARRRGDDAWAFEVLLERQDGDAWIYRRDARITRPLASFGRTARDGLPCVAPEIALLYKSTTSATSGIERNAADFRVAAPLLDADARRWLRDAIALIDPPHPWPAVLS
ncbi:MAG: nucleotidyltransferase domain-containing protein, partial [Gemmatimonadaceae bacterium]